MSAHVMADTMGGVEMAPAQAAQRSNEPDPAGHRLELVRREREAQQAAAAVPARRSPFAAERRDWSPVAAAAQGVAVEQYRRLAGALIRAQSDHGVKVVMISSAVAGEGKSLTCANLAVTLARSYQRETLVVDADLRDPSQHQVFQVHNGQGLTEHLRALEYTPPRLLELFPGLNLLTAGRPTSDPMSGLTSGRMKQLLSDTAQVFDFVLVDTPPVTLIPDAGLLAPLVDAVVLVIAAGQTHYEAIASAVTTVGRERILGTVLNGAEPSSFGRYGYGYGYGYGKGAGTR